MWNLATLVTQQGKSTTIHRLTNKNEFFMVNKGRSVADSEYAFHYFRYIFTYHHNGNLLCSIIEQNH